jgi:endoglucanase
MKQADRDFLFRLLETPSPTGFEMPGQRVWAEWIGQYAPQVGCDAYGSTWATLPGKSKSTIMLEAHADEIGYMIKHVDDKGFLRLDRVGGSDAATARGRRLTLLGDKGAVAGIIGNTAIHLRRDERGSEKAPAVHDLWVEEIGLHPGVPQCHPGRNRWPRRNDGHLPHQAGPVHLPGCHPCH